MGIVEESGRRRRGGCLLSREGYEKGGEIG